VKSLELLEGAALSSCARVSGQLPEWLWLCEGAARTACGGPQSLLASSPALPSHFCRPKRKISVAQLEVEGEFLLAFFLL